MNAQAKNLQALYAETRLLLALWDLGANEQEVKKGLLTKRIVAKGQKMADYKGILEDLQEQGAVTVSKTGYTLKSPIGLDVLGAGLRSSEFKFEGSIVGTWAANALLRWIGQINVVAAPVASGGGVIGSYEEFKSVALAVYEKLNYEHNLNNLVPIYRIRRVIGERVNRTEFNDFLLEMQADDIFQLQGGTVEDNARDKIEDSISTKLDGLRCYAIRL
ncbi:MAG: hypothetical protein PT119_14180 [Aphanizomenon gracile PMC627.10]|nr:hypothetical protein [Aphanizomenon gracile PMC627.10]